MKIKIFTVVILIIFIFISNSIALNSLSSDNGVNVWAVGNSGYIIYSTNSGATWSNLNLGSSNLNAISVKSNSIWVGSESGLIYRSINSGLSWDSTSGFTPIKSIYFFDVITGYFCTNTGQIYKTTNSGSNWTSVPSGTTNGLNSIKFNDSNN